MRAWMIDVGVWLGALLTLLLVAVVTIQTTTPPDPQTLREQAAWADFDKIQADRTRYATQCLSNPDMLTYVPDELHSSYCECLARFTAGGNQPLAPGRPLKCLQDAARTLTDRLNIVADFQSVFPAACSQIQQQLTGRLPDHLGGPFCSCLQKRIGDDRARMAEYVIAGSERIDTGQAKSDVAICRQQTNLR